MSDAYRAYVKELARVFKEKALAAREALERARSHSCPHPMREEGRLLGYYEVMSTIVQQAIAFQIPRHALGLKKLDPDRLISWQGNRGWGFSQIARDRILEHWRREVRIFEEQAEALRQLLEEKKRHE